MIKYRMCHKRIFSIELCLLICLSSLNFSIIQHVSAVNNWAAYPDVCRFGTDNSWMMLADIYSEDCFEYATDIPSENQVNHSGLTLSWEALNYGQISDQHKAYLTYSVKENTAFCLKSYRVSSLCNAIQSETGTQPGLSVYCSSDGYQWMPVNGIFESVPYAYSSWYDYYDTYTVNSLPTATAYVKIEFPQTKCYQNGGNAALIIDSVAYTGNGTKVNFNDADETTLPDFVNEPYGVVCDQTDALGERLLSVRFDALQYGWVNEQNPASFVMDSVTPGTTVTVTTAVIRHVEDKLKELIGLDMKFSFLGSENATDWQPLVSVCYSDTGDDGGDNAWARGFDNYVISIPDNINHLKIIFPQVSFYNDVLGGIQGTGINWNFNYSSCTHYSFAVKSIRYQKNDNISHGDINADSNIDSNDMALLRKHVLEESANISQKADVNEDSLINIKDIVRLKKYFADPQNEYLFSYGSNHPANRNLNYFYNGTITNEVLNNYLDRAIVVSLFDRINDDVDFTEDNLRMILNTGAKYIARSYTVWLPDASQEQTYPQIAAMIERAHKKDPDIIFEACIFETAWQGMNTIEIPDWVFNAFGQTPETRNFDYQKMLFPDGTMKDEFGAGISCPDITQLETRMFIYYRARVLMDMGFESLHIGQTWRVGQNDAGYQYYAQVLNMIRTYAQGHTRRGMVLINSHHNGDFKTADGKYLVDFICSPSCLYDQSNGAAHLPQEYNPQNADIRYSFGPYGTTGGGITPSGWYTEKMPYLVEFDNWMESPADIAGQLSSTTGIMCVPWGYDEISWYMNQPKWYRLRTLDYMYRTVQCYDTNGHFEMPGLRSGFYIPDATVQYHSASRTNGSFNWAEEDTIRQIWVQSNRS